MNKIFINTMDKQIEYDYSICTLVTENYKTTLKPNSIHSPSAGKLIVEFEGNIKAFLLKQPIISINEKGYIEVLTTMTWEESTYQGTKVYTPAEVRELKRIKKLIATKKSMGLSFDEIFTEREVISKLNIIALKKKKLHINEGGGF